MIYNFNLGIGWASSGVEYAQLYRARMLRALDAPARFIFTDMFPQENIEHYTKKMGFRDKEILWLYTFFTDFHTAPVTYTLEDFQKTLPDGDCSLQRAGKIGRLYLSDQDFYTLYFVKETENRLHRVEYVSGGCLIRKDYFTYGRVYSEYYAPLDSKAHLYLRRFFNTDGSAAYEEIIDDGDVMYRFPDQIFYSKEELVGYMVRCLHLKRKDVVIIDRTTGIGQAILQNCGPARVGIVVHADHYSAGSTNEQNILWNNFYEYAFDMSKHISFFITSTNAQRDLMRAQFEKYTGKVPDIRTIPVGSLDRLRCPDSGRKPFSIVTASRLASEKHVDWIIEACVKAKKEVPDLTLDIYGEGGEYQRLLQLIRDNRADGYIRLMGQQDMTDVYKNYELYLSGSTSEGFGLSLMEAVGSGLPVIGFDVPYGNPTFIEDGRNGYLIPVDENTTIPEHVDGLYKSVVKYFQTADRTSFQKHSYEIAQSFLTEKVTRKWQKLIRLK